MEKDKKLKRALNNAYCLLRSRPRSEAEIRMRLKLKGYGAAEIEEAVAALARAGQIDDAKFARLWIDSRMQANPMGDIVLKRELKAKGVSEPIIESALAEKAERYDEYATALNMASERLKQLAKLDRRKALKRLHDFLLRRGFGFEVIQKVIGELIQNFASLIFYHDRE